VMDMPAVPAVVLVYVFFLFLWYWAHLVVHSFPTRRSSDLARGREIHRAGVVEGSAVHGHQRTESDRHARVDIECPCAADAAAGPDRRSTRLNYSHVAAAYAAV